MREHLLKLLRERTISDGLTAEDFFLAGPPATPKDASNAVRQEALLADIQRQQRHSQHALAA